MACTSAPTPVSTGPAEAAAGGPAPGRPDAHPASPADESGAVSVPAGALRG
ncbi:hypothetical protein I7412_39495 [Frankia sp. CN6]|uniref:Uncharacterized protein n=1 Tax=Frankia nepalensis TaxID=1836974 RepID=A0A937RIZ7_9ACTN|nr:hypothetical protein [Frankia nepalensis]